jgi:hypothetical protein
MVRVSQRPVIDPGYAVRGLTEWAKSHSRERVTCDGFLVSAGWPPGCPCAGALDRRSVLCLGKQGEQL